MADECVESVSKRPRPTEDEAPTVAEFIALRRAKFDEIQAEHTRQARRLIASVLRHKASVAEHSNTVLVHMNACPGFNEDIIRSWLCDELGYASLDVLYTANCVKITLEKEANA